MAQDITSELADFHQFVASQLDNGGAGLSPEECLELWRAERPSSEELQDSVAAVKRALEQADRGEGKSLDEFDRDFRARHNITQDV